MGKQILIVVDMQNDFITGTLGMKEAQAIVPKVAEKISTFEGDVYFTMDTHDETYETSQEGKALPVVHCQEGTEGWQLAPQIIAAAPVDPEKIYCKGQFGSVELAEDLQYLHEVEPIDSIELVGLCTDICVVSNALVLKAFLPEVPIIVDSAYCAGVTPEKHEAALETMKSCQIHVI